jgi:hypothetical protein
LHARGDGHESPAQYITQYDSVPRKAQLNEPVLQVP